LTYSSSPFFYLHHFPFAFSSLLRFLDLSSSSLQPLLPPPSLGPPLSPRSDRFKPTEAHIPITAPLSAADEKRRAVKLDSWQFQSVFWGAEHIYSGDIVRLMQCPNMSGVLAQEASGDEQDRTLIMKVATIYKDAETGRAKIGGEIYELRDLRLGPPPEAVIVGGAMSAFEKAQPSTSALNGSSAPTSQDKGKEKEKENEGVDGGVSGVSNGVNGSDKIDYEARNDGRKGGPYKQPRSAASVVDTFPQPPVGYVWRLLSASNQQVHVELEYLGGRFHPLPKELDRPDVLERVLNADAFDISKQADEPKGGEGGGGDAAKLTMEERAVVLTGLKQTYRLYMSAFLLSPFPPYDADLIPFAECGHYRDNRNGQIIEAEKAAAVRLLLPSLPRCPSFLCLSYSLFLSHSPHSPLPSYSISLPGPLADHPAPLLSNEQDEVAEFFERYEQSPTPMLQTNDAAQAAVQPQLEQQQEQQQPTPMIQV
jgi:hypothetical protein